MAEQMKGITGALVYVRDKVIEKAQEYTLDRLVWCIAAIAFAWCEVQDYHKYVFWKQMWILAGIGTFYCLKLGFFAKGKRILCAVATLFGVGITVHMVQNNYFFNFYYHNLPAGVLLTVLLNLYLLVFLKSIEQKRIPIEIGPSLILVCMLIVMQFSIFDFKDIYLAILLTLLPLILMKKGYRTRSSVLNGLIDGMCIGFLVLQCYAWMHRPYSFSVLRYAGTSNSTTTMSRIYLGYFAAWLIRYVQIARMKIGFFSVIGRVIAWFITAFILSLEYLTGSRSAVLAMILMVAVAVAVRYFRVKDKWWLRVLKLFLYPINCVCIGLVSLALFPLAYASVRYLPAYFNDPDYIDAMGARLKSMYIQDWGENFGWDYEYDEYVVKIDEEPNSPRYATFAECATHNLGRIIPWADVYLKDVLSEKLLESGLERVEFYYDQGIYEEWTYKYEVDYLNSSYGQKEDTENKVSSSDELLGLVEEDWLSIYKQILEKLLSTLVLRTDAAGLFDKWIQVTPGLGDSSETPWFSAEEYPGNGFALRFSIHEYAISKLNNEGHSAGSFNMWVTEYNSQPHAHNIFLIMGYDFGIPTMLLMALLFVTTFFAGLYNILRYERTEYLLPILLVAGMTVFGWFESGFDYKSGAMMWIFLSVIFTNVLIPKKAKVKANVNIPDTTE